MNRFGEENVNNHIHRAHMGNFKSKSQMERNKQNTSFPDGPQTLLRKSEQLLLQSYYYRSLHLHQRLTSLESLLHQRSRTPQQPVSLLRQTQPLLPQLQLQLQRRPEPQSPSPPQAQSPRTYAQLAQPRSPPTTQQLIQSRSSPPIRALRPVNKTRNPIQYFLSSVACGYNSPSKNILQDRQNNLTVLKPRVDSRRERITVAEQTIERHGPKHKNNSTVENNTYPTNRNTSFVNAPPNIENAHQDPNNSRSDPKCEQREGVPQSKQNENEKDFIYEMELSSKKIMNSNKQNGTKSESSTLKVDPETSKLQVTSQSNPLDHDVIAPSTNNPLKPEKGTGNRNETPRFEKNLLPTIHEENLEDLSNRVMRDESDTVLPLFNYEDTSTSIDLGKQNESPGEDHYPKNASLKGGVQSQTKPFGSTVMRAIEHVDYPHQSGSQFDQTSPHASNWNPLTSTDSPICEGGSRNIHPAMTPQCTFSDPPSDPKKVVVSEKVKHLFHAADVLTKNGSEGRCNEERVEASASYSPNPKDNNSQIQIVSETKENAKDIQLLPIDLSTENESINMYSNDIINFKVTSLEKFTSHNVMETFIESWKVEPNNNKTKQPEDEAGPFQAQIGATGDYRKTKRSTVTQKVGILPYANLQNGYVQNNTTQSNDTAIKSVVFYNTSNHHNQIRDAASQNLNNPFNTVNSSRVDENESVSVLQKKASGNTLQNHGQPSQGSTLDTIQLVQKLQDLLLETQPDLVRDHSIPQPEIPINRQNELRQTKHSKSLSTVQNIPQKNDNSSEKVILDSESKSQNTFNNQETAQDSASEAGMQGLKASPNMTPGAEMRSQSTEDARKCSTEIEAKKNVQFDLQFAHQSQMSQSLALGDDQSSQSKLMSEKSSANEIFLEDSKPIEDTDILVPKYHELLEYDEEITVEMKEIIQNSDIDKNLQNNAIANAAKDAYKTCDPLKFKKVLDDGYVWIPRTSTMDHLESPLAKYNQNTVDGNPYHCFAASQKTEPIQVPAFIEDAWNSVAHRWKVVPGEDPYRDRQNRGWADTAFMPFAHTRQRASVGFEYPNLGELPAMHITTRNQEGRATRQGLTSESGQSRKCFNEERTAAESEPSSLMENNDINEKWPIVVDSDKIVIPDWHSFRSVIDYPMHRMPWDISGMDTSVENQRQKSECRREEIKAKYMQDQVVELEIMHVAQLY